MKRILGHVVSAVAVAVGLAAVAPACAENDQSIFIRQVMLPSTNRTNGACVYTADPQQPALFEGTFDVGVRDTYFAVLLVGNQMIRRGDPNNTRAEPNRVHVDGVVVRVTEPDGAVIGEFTALGSGFADPQQNNAPGYGLLGATVIDAPTKDKIAAALPNALATKKVVLNLKPFGKSLGGEDLEGGEFQFTVNACNGCLVTFTGANDPAQQPQPNCKAAIGGSSGGGGSQVLPCYAGQDEAVPCQLCQGKPACDPSKR